MGVFQFETNDGHAYEIEAPDADTAIRAFRGQMSGAEAAKPSMLESFARGMGDTGWLGYGDEATAAIKTGAGMWGDYGAELEAQRAKRSAAETAHPAAFMTGQVAGGVPMALIPAGAGARTAGFGSKVAASALTGGVEGGIYGFGSGEGGLENRMKSAGVGAGVGLAAGAAAPIVGRGVGAVAGKIYGRSGVDAASDQIARAMENDAVDPAALGQLAPETMLADLGPNLRQKAAVAAAQPGEGQKIVRQAMADRAANAGQRTQAAVDTALGPRQNIPQTAEQIAQQRATAAAPLYQQAYQTPIQVTPAITSVLETPTGRAALARAVKIAADERAPIDPKNLDTRALDYVKRGLDDVAGSLARGGRREQLRAVMDMKNTLLSEMDQMNPTYAQARAAYAGPSGVLDALEAGRTVFSRSVSPDELRQTLTTINQSERDAFRIGARSQIEEIMATARNDASAAARELADKGWNREKLNLVVGQKAANDLVEALNLEKTYANTANKVTQNSETATRVAGMFNIPVGLRPAFEAGGFMGLLRAGGIKAVEGLLRGANEEQLNRLGADIARQVTATGADRDAVINILRGIAKRRANQADLVNKVDFLTQVVGNSAGQVGGNRAVQPKRGPLQVEVTRPANWDEVNPQRRP